MNSMGGASSVTSEIDDRVAALGVLYLWIQRNWSGFPSVFSDACIVTIPRQVPR